MIFEVYILYSKVIDRYYVGYTTDLERRLTEHNRKKGKYTDSGIPWHLVYSETYSTKTEAMQREKFIKLKKSRSFIESLIRSSEG
ncbi:MAG TPA: GIY-YIG nuclease family protein [Draconibacterium sp.]|nr:GIY-YIG nuclease family protein [Draconibacterium sp.]HPE77354.1 GIY-YIG nuclease family protein [Draconibacterium sp.]